MSDNVIDFTARRAAAKHQGGDLVYCPCGDVWWELRDGGVCFATDQTVTGWAGTPHCKSCGKPMGTAR